MFFIQVVCRMFFFPPPPKKKKRFMARGFLKGLSFQASFRMISTNFFGEIFLGGNCGKGPNFPLQDGPRADHYKWSLKKPYSMAGCLNMGNWGYFTPINRSRYIGSGAHFVPELVFRKITMFFPEAKNDMFQEVTR